MHIFGTGRRKTPSSELVPGEVIPATVLPHGRAPPCHTIDQTNHPHISSPPSPFHSSNKIAPLPPPSSPPIILPQPIPKQQIAIFPLVSSPRHDPTSNTFQSPPCPYNNNPTTINSNSKSPSPLSLSPTPSPSVALLADAGRPGAPIPIMQSRVSKPLGQERRMSFFRLDDFILVRPLGTGTFGRVYLARYRTLPKYFALKKLRKIDVLRLKQVEHVQNERSLLSRLTHPFIIKMYAALQDQRNLYMLMEYANGGELFYYLRKAGRFGLAAARFYAAELVLALEYLHAHGIVYRDLKPENLLLDSEGHLKLADFGFAKIIDHSTYTLCGTPEYLAPEIILGRGYGISVDWWALGVLIFEVLTGNPPFIGDTPTAVYEKTLRGKIQYPNGMSPVAISLISGLLTVDLTKRLGSSEPSMAAIKEHEFFSGIDWEMVYQRSYPPPIIPKAGDPDMAVNFPYDDSKSSMDVEIDNEEQLLRMYGQGFSGFGPA